MKSFIVLALALCGLVYAVNGQSVQNVSTPYATAHSFDCTGSSGTVDWYYLDQTTNAVLGKLAANETFKIDGSKLTIAETRKDQLSVNYFCNSTGFAGIRFNVQPQPYMYVLEKSSVTVTEEGSASATCKLIVGFQNNLNVVWTWVINGANANLSDTRIIVDSSSNSSTIQVKSVQHSDKGSYVCVASNGVGSYNSTITVRVKSKLAALWPFLAIVGEVIILCIIILIFEKRCGKKPDADKKQ